MVISPTFFDSMKLVAGSPFFGIGSQRNLHEVLMFPHLSQNSTGVSCPNWRFGKGREYTRVDVSFPATLMTPQGPVDGEVKNISLGGALFVFSDPPNANATVLDVAIEIPGHQYTIWAKVEMVRFDIHVADDFTFSYGLSVRFKEISEDDLGFLTSTILR